LERANNKTSGKIEISYHRYFDQKEKNVEKIFWGRGNGWVMGGLAKILKELPEQAYLREFYEKLFKESGLTLKLLKRI